MKARLLAVLFCFVFLLGYSSDAEAASLYIDPAFNTLSRGDSATLAVRLNVDKQAGECVNVVDATIHYSSNIELVDVSIGDSIMSIWPERPVINRESRTVTFAGGIPNGYCGRVEGDPRLTNVLAEVVVRSPGMIISGGDVDNTKAELYFDESATVLLNDGRGTPAQLMTYGAQFELLKKPGNELRNDWQDEVNADVTPPEEFSIFMFQNPNGKYSIAFETTDKQTGIDRFEVIEEPFSTVSAFKWGRADAPWIETRSPYVLEDQTLNSVIRVKAVDKAGNEYIATLMPEDSMRGISQADVITAVVIVIIAITFFMLGFVFWRVILRRKTTLGRKPKPDMDEEDELDDETEIDYEKN